MTSRVAFPFLTLSDAAVSVTKWEISRNGSDFSAVTDYISDWDPSITLHFRRRVSVKPELVASELAIPKDCLKIAATVRVGTGQGRIPRSSIAKSNYSLQAPEWTCEIQSMIPGNAASSIIDLRLEILLAEEPAKCGQLSPKRRGDRLWSDTLRVFLEGEEPRFPIEIANLAVMLNDPSQAAAPWHLHWSASDWNRDFHGAVRLFLNENNKGILDRIHGHDTITLQLLLADIVSQVCDRFLQDHTSDEQLLDLDPSSIAMQARTWLNKAWPGRDLASIRNIRFSHPGKFRSAILAMALPGES
jgi:hypothetical protein